MSISSTLVHRVEIQFHEAADSLRAFVGCFWVVTADRGATIRVVPDGSTAISIQLVTKELIAGFWLWQVKSLVEAVAWVKRCPNPMGTESEVEIRPVFEMEDFGAAVTPEIKAQEDRVRAGGGKAPVAVNV